jgi:hypothetical protein
MIASVGTKRQEYNERQGRIEHIKVRVVDRFFSTRTDSSNRGNWKRSRRP